MRTLYAVALLLGLLSLVGWMVVAAVADSVAAWEWADPESRIGPVGRRTVAGLVGLGMAGLSAAFAGWPQWAAAMAAALGAAVAAWLAGALGGKGDPGTDDSGVWRPSPQENGEA